jgi:hypothetical protein
MGRDLCIWAALLTAFFDVLEYIPLSLGGSSARLPPKKIHLMRVRKDKACERKKQSSVKM